MAVAVRAFVVAALMTTLGSNVAVAGADETAPSTTMSTATTNPFFPDDESANLTDCVGTLQRPDCGSRERGGWRQGVLFGVVVAGLVAIGTRIVIGIRRRDREITGDA
jgi:hypothetical protein